MWDLSSPARGRPMPVALEVQGLRPWMTREVPVKLHFQWSVHILSGSGPEERGLPQRLGLRFTGSEPLA